MLAPFVPGRAIFGDAIQYNSNSLRETSLAYVSVKDMEAIAHA